MSARTPASRASANMLMPMAIAAAAMTPMTENARRRMGSIRLALIDEHRGQKQPEPDERREENQIPQRNDPASQRLVPVDHRQTPRDLRHDRRVPIEEIRHQRIRRRGEDEAYGDTQHERDDLIASQGR